MIYRPMEIIKINQPGKGLYEGTRFSSMFAQEILDKYCNREDYPWSNASMIFLMQTEGEQERRADEKEIFYVTWNLFQLYLENRLQKSGGEKGNVFFSLNFRRMIETNLWQLERQNLKLYQELKRIYETAEATTPETVEQELKILEKNYFSQGTLGQSVQQQRSYNSNERSPQGTNFLNAGSFPAERKSKQLGRVSSHRGRRVRLQPILSLETNFNRFVMNQVLSEGRGESGGSFFHGRSGAQGLIWRTQREPQTNQRESRGISQSQSLSTNQNLLEIQMRSEIQRLPEIQNFYKESNRSFNSFSLAGIKGLLNEPSFGGAFRETGTQGGNDRLGSGNRGGKAWPDRWNNREKERWGFLQALNWMPLAGMDHPHGGRRSQREIQNWYQGGNWSRILQFLSFGGGKSQGVRTEKGVYQERIFLRESNQREIGNEILRQVWNRSVQILPVAGRFVDRYQMRDMESPERRSGLDRSVDGRIDRLSPLISWETKFRKPVINQSFLNGAAGREETSTSFARAGYQRQVWRETPAKGRELAERLNWVWQSVYLPLMQANEAKHQSLREIQNLPEIRNFYGEKNRNFKFLSFAGISQMLKGMPFGEGAGETRTQGNHYRPSLEKARAMEWLNPWNQRKEPADSPQSLIRMSVIDSRTPELKGKRQREIQNRYERGDWIRILQLLDSGGGKNEEAKASNRAYQERILLREFNQRETSNEMIRQIWNRSFQIPSEVDRIVNSYKIRDKRSSERGIVFDQRSGKALGEHSGGIERALRGRRLEIHNNQQTQIGSISRMIRSLHQFSFGESNEILYPRSPLRAAAERGRQERESSSGTFSYPSVNSFVYAEKGAQKSREPQPDRREEEMQEIRALETKITKQEYMANQEKTLIEELTKKVEKQEQMMERLTKEQMERFSRTRKAEGNRLSRGVLNQLKSELYLDRLRSGLE